MQWGIYRNGVWSLMWVALLSLLACAVSADTAARPLADSVQLLWILWREQ